MIDISISNHSSRSITFMFENDWLQRTLIDPQGRISKWVPEEPHGSSLTSLTEIKPGETKTFPCAVVETAALSIPGDYTLNILVTQLGLSDVLPFTARPYDAVALRKWADDATDRIISRSGDSTELTKALGSIRADISEPDLCRLLKESVYIAAQRLADIGDNDAVTCLIDSLPQHHGADKEAVEAILRNVQRKTSDMHLRVRVTAALSSGTAH